MFNVASRDIRSFVSRAIVFVVGEVPNDRA